jgi:hypothetical protein
VIKILQYLQAPPSSVVTFPVSTAIGAATHLLKNLYYSNPTLDYPRSHANLLKPKRSGSSLQIESLLSPSFLWELWEPWELSSFFIAPVLWEPSSSSVSAAIHACYICAVKGNPLMLMFSLLWELAQAFAILKSDMFLI